MAMHVAVEIKIRKEPKVFILSTWKDGITIFCIGASCRRNRSGGVNQAALEAAASLLSDCLFFLRQLIYLSPGQVKVFL